MSLRRHESRAAAERRVAEAAGPPPGTRLRGARWEVLAAIAPVLVLLLYVTAALDVGFSATAAIRVLAAIIGTQVLPGVCIWRLIRRGAGSWSEDLTVGTAIGIVIAIGAQTLAGVLRLPLVAVVSGPLVAAILLAIPSTRGRIREADTRVLPPIWGLGVAATALIFLPQALSFFRRVPVAWTEGFRAIYIDMPFHLAIVGEVAHRGPSQIPYVLGEPLRYHWFSHAWTAQVGFSANVEFAAVLFRVLPAVVSVLAVATIAAVGSRVSQHTWVGPLAAFLAAVMGNLVLLGGARPTNFLIHRSPGLGVSVVLMMAAVALITMRMRGEAGRGSGLVVLLLVFAAAGSKGSSVAVLFPGVAVAAAYAWLRRLPGRRAIAMDVLSVAAALLLSLALVFGGADRGVEFAPLVAMGRSAAAAGLLASDVLGAATIVAAVMVVAVELLARAIGLLALAPLPSLRTDVPFVLLAVSGTAGVVAASVFTHPGGSQAYFLRNGSPALAVATAVGLGALLATVAHTRDRLNLLTVGIITGVAALIARSVLPGRATPGGVAIAALVTFAVVTMGAAAGWLANRDAASSAVRSALVVVVAVITTIGGPVLQARTSVALPAPLENLEPGARRAFSADQVEAARWLRDHSAVDSVIATNRHCGVQEWARCDSRRFFVSAYTERRIVVEGWAYTGSWMQSPGVDGAADAYKPFWDPSRLELNDAFFESPTVAGAHALRQLGVRWLYVDKTAPYSDRLTMFASPRYETDWAIVMEL